MSKMKMLKQVQISLWTNSQNPLTDKPHEIGGVMQDTLEDTIRFASEMIRSHWQGECDCVYGPSITGQVGTFPDDLKQFLDRLEDSLEQRIHAYGDGSVAGLTLLEVLNAVAEAREKPAPVLTMLSKKDRG